MSDYHQDVDVRKWAFEQAQNFTDDDHHDYFKNTIACAKELYDWTTSNGKDE